MKKYPWLVHFKNKNYNFCKYCKIRFYGKYSHHKHSLSMCHKQSEKLYLEKKRKLQLNTQPPALVEKPAHMSERALVVKWKHKFSWLLFKRNEKRLNYGYCHICEQAIYLPSYKFAANHQKSSRHLKNVRLKKNHNHDEIDKVEKIIFTKKNDRDKSELEQFAIQYPWISPYKNSKSMGYCKYCDLPINIIGSNKERHQDTHKHQNAEKIYKEKNKILETNNSVILDDSEDEIISIKSEVDEDITLIINRHKDIENKLVNTRKRSYETVCESDIKIAKRLTAAHSELLTSMRSICDKKNETRISSTKIPLNVFASSFSMVEKLGSLALRNTTELKGQTIPESSLQSPKSFSPNTSSSTINKSVRTAYDLLLENVSQTVKTLPSDLAEEMRIRIMQVVCEMELKFLHRKKSNNDKNLIEENKTNNNEIINNCFDDKSNNAVSVVIENPVENNASTTIISQSIPKASDNTKQITYSNSQTNYNKNASKVFAPQIRNGEPSVASKSVVVNVDKCIRRIQTNPSVQKSSNVESSGIRCIPLSALTQSTNYPTIKRINSLQQTKIISVNPGSLPTVQKTNLLPSQLSTQHVIINKNSGQI